MKRPLQITLVVRLYVYCYCFPDHLFYNIFSFIVYLERFLSIQRGFSHPPMTTPNTPDTPRHPLASPVPSGTPWHPPALPSLFYTKSTPGIRQRYQVFRPGYFSQKSEPGRRPKMLQIYKEYVFIDRSTNDWKEGDEGG